MTKLKIKKGDKVVVLAGKSAGKEGKVLRVWPDSRRLVVEGLNLQKKRERPRQQGKKGQVVEVPAPLPTANVALYCASCGRGVRAGYKITGQSKVRVCRKCGKEI